MAILGEKSRGGANKNPWYYSRKLAVPALAFMIFLNGISLSGCDEQVKVEDVQPGPGGDGDNGGGNDNSGTNSNGDDGATPDPEVNGTNNTVIDNPYESMTPGHLDYDILRHYEDIDKLREEHEDILQLAIIGFEEMFNNPEAIKQLGGKAEMAGDPILSEGVWVIPYTLNGEARQMSLSIAVAKGKFRDQSEEAK